MKQWTKRMNKKNEGYTTSRIKKKKKKENEGSKRQWNEAMTLLICHVIRTMREECSLCIAASKNRFEDMG